MKKLLWPGILFANLLLVGYFWWTGGSGELWRSGSDGVLIALGRLAGLLGQLLLLVQLALIGRVGPLERSFGMDKLIRPHRYLGYGLLGLFVLHPLLLSFGHAGTGASPQAAVQQLSDFLRYWEDVFNAFLALIIFTAVVFASIPPVRRRLRYERWYAFHLLVYVAIVLVFGHQTATGDLQSGSALFYWFALNFGVFGLFVCYRFLRPLWLWRRHRFQIERVVAETHDVHSVYLRGRQLDRFSWQAGQFANLYFLQRGFGWSHPFSFSQPVNGENLRFSIKAVGDFTRQIPKLASGTQVIVDGPLGLFTAAQSRLDKFLLIAGGIGITPIRSLAEELTKNNKDVVLIYAAKTDRDFALRGELEQLPQLKAEYLTGHLDFAVIAAKVPDYHEREIYICGPKGMMRMLVKNFMDSGMPRSQLHFERFEY